MFLKKDLVRTAKHKTKLQWFGIFNSWYGFAHVCVCVCVFSYLLIFSLCALVGGLSKSIYMCSMCTLHLQFSNQSKTLSNGSNKNTTYMYKKIYNAIGRVDCFMFSTTKVVVLTIDKELFFHDFLISVRKHLSTSFKLKHCMNWQYIVMKQVQMKSCEFLVQNTEVLGRKKMSKKWEVPLQRSEVQM